MTTFLDPTDRLLFGTNPTTDPIFSDGVVPKKFWVSPNGTDGDANGRPDAPFATITFAISKCGSGRGDTIYVGPGSYAECVNVTSPNIAIIGTGNRHSGITQIIGDTTTTLTATVNVASGAESGFKLANVELDSNGVNRPALSITTSDSGATPTATAAPYRFVVENVAVRSRRPSCGFLLAGATLGEFRRCVINGPLVGIGFTGSTNNNPSDLIFEDFDFYNGFSTTVTADIATVQGVSGVPSQTVGAAVGALTNILFKRVNFGSVATGAGGATNFINLSSTVTCLNVSFLDVNMPRAATNGTNGVNTLPTNVIVTGWAQSSTRLALKG